MRTLQVRNDSGVVTLPKEGLERDGVIEDGTFPDDFEQNVVVDRLGERQYLVRLVDGDIPELTEAEVVRQVAAQLAFEEDHLGRARAD